MRGLPSRDTTSKGRQWPRRGVWKKKRQQTGLVGCRGSQSWASDFRQNLDGGASVPRCFGTHQTNEAMSSSCFQDKETEAPGA